jgi:hypothetical protein
LATIGFDRNPRRNHRIILESNLSLIILLDWKSLKTPQAIFLCVFIPSGQDPKFAIDAFCLDQNRLFTIPAFDRGLKLKGARPLQFAEITGYIEFA